MRILCLLAAVVSVAAQIPPVKPFQSQSPSSVSLTVAKDGEQTLEITNASYEMTSTAVPGRPTDERLLLRTVTRSKQVIGDIGEEATTTVDAWPLGTDLKQKPLYTVKVSGEDRRTLEGEVFTISRGLEEVEWWSLYKLGTGEHLFDTYVPLLHFSIARDTVTTRYAGITVPEGDRDAHAIGTLYYASADKVKKTVLITSDDPKTAVRLRSLADASLALSYSDHVLRLAISQNYPSPASTATITIPVVKDDLDLAHAVLPPHVQLAAKKP